MEPLEDNSDQALALLKQIAKNTGSIGGVGSDGGSGDTNITIGNDAITGPTAASGYFSSGENRVALPELSEEPEQVEFGKVLTTFSIRFDNPVRLWLARPQRSQPIVLENSPFSIGGGDAPVGVDSIWLQSHTTTQATIRMEGY
jgi:hypothetical protein